MIIVVGGIKGGSGKTTVATNIAILRSLDDKDVLLIDADDQETATDFTINRHNERGETGYTSIKLSGHAVTNETLKLKSKYNDIIIDTGGRDTTSQRAALAIADVYLVPFVPRSFDVWTINKVALLVKESLTCNPKLKSYTFINRADSRGEDNDDAGEFLRKQEFLNFIDTPLGTRKAFGNASAFGCAVTELQKQDEKASKEIKILYKYIFNT
jgi:chromosome partitioning protein